MKLHLQPGGHIPYQKFSCLNFKSRVHNASSSFLFAAEKSQNIHPLFLMQKYMQNKDAYTTKKQILQYAHITINFKICHLDDTVINDILFIQHSSNYIFSLQSLLIMSFHMGYFCPIYSKITNRLIQSIGLDNVSIPIKNQHQFNKIIRHTFMKDRVVFFFFLYKVKTRAIDPIILSLFATIPPKQSSFIFSVTIYYFILGKNGV